jgi:hypothetical protein
VGLLQGLIAIGLARININRTSSNCRFEFVMGLQIAKHATDRKVDSYVDYSYEHAYFGHNFTCDELFFCHNGTHLVAT